MVCGPLSGVGKSTVARSISTNLQKIKKKVALVDCDYHRGDLHKDFNVQRPSIDSLSKSRFDIEKFRINENLIFIPRPKNSSDYAITHFESEDFASMVSMLKETLIMLLTPHHAFFVRCFKTFKVCRQDNSYWKA